MFIHAYIGFRHTVFVICVTVEIDLNNVVYVNKLDVPVTNNEVDAHVNNLSADVHANNVVADSHANNEVGVDVIITDCSYKAADCDEGVSLV